MKGDPLHQPGGPATFWTTINAEENLTGVVDPLSGSFWLGPVTLGTLGAFSDMGVVPEREVVYSDEPDRRITSVIYGRFCANIDLVRRLADLTPGTSGEAMERDLFGNARAGIPSRRSVRRYPIVVVKAPRAAALVARRLNGAMPASQSWWRRSVSELASGDATAARAKLGEAHAHMAATMRPHTLGTMLVQGVLGQVRGLAERVGKPGLELELSRGLGSLEEVGVLERLWEISRDRGDMAAFVAEFGFHGPGEGAPTSVSWREDSSPLDAIVDAYRSMADARSPTAAAAAVAARRRSAAAELMGSLPAPRRPAARLLLSYGDKLWALRETGKAAYLHAIDVARAAARIIGGELAAEGRIDDDADAAYLTVEELLAQDARDWAEDVAFRRARREQYQSFDVPQTWNGTPERIERGDGGATEETSEITGLGASPGLAEGTVRVVSDPSRSELSDGDVLVCKTTDPSWGTLFLIASAVVIDVGASSSHGAIVARELGVPCVINTRTGTAVLGDGDRVRVDGAAGVVRVLERAARDV